MTSHDSQHDASRDLESRSLLQADADDGRQQNEVHQQGQEQESDTASDPPPVPPSHLTLRSIAAGAVVGTFVVAMNINFGLKIGWTQGGNILAVVVGISIFSALKPAIKFTEKEANITQTVASAAGATKPPTPRPWPS